MIFTNDNFSEVQKRNVRSKTVEKVLKQTLWEDAEKNDFTECATINNLTIMKGRETLKNQALTIVKDLSIVSADIEPSPQKGVGLVPLGC